MNLAEALIQALPELPAQVLAKKKYKLNPDVVVREELNEDLQPVVVIYIPEKAWMIKTSHDQYQLLQLFNGERTNAEVAQAYAEQFGATMTEEQVAEFASGAVDSGLWYVSPQERNITLSQKLAEERRKRIKQKGKFADLSHIIFQGWNPDEFLGKAHEKLKWVYSLWVTLLTSGLFVYMVYVWIDRWPELGRDTLQYYTFTEKTGWDIAEFWLLFLIMAFFHESAHGLTCKHFGARVPNMGFQLIYLAPAFATEITEIWVRAGKRERLLAIIAGIWMEGIFCGVATVVWAGTPPGTPAHEWAYKVMLITGIITLIVNLNPLIKLDGYYALAEIVGISELKEQSTAYLSGWVKKNIFRLPAEYDYAPVKRRFLYVPYAILSGAYSYVLLFAVSRFTFNVFSRWFAEWAFVPAGLVAWKIFRSRIYRLAAFMKSVYLDKREHIWKSMPPARWAAVGVMAIVILAVPVFRKSSGALFVLEPAKKAEIRAEVAGLVEKVYVGENSEVQAGEPLVVLKNVTIEGEAAKANAQRTTATANLMEAQLKFGNMGSARSDLARTEEISDATDAQLRQLRPVAPMAGSVLTPRVKNLEGQFVAAGAPLMEIADTQVLRARLYLPEFEVRDLRPSAPVSLRLLSQWSPVRGRVESIGAAPSELPSGLVEQNKYKGLNPPKFYVVDVLVSNPGNLKPGMSGDAKVFVKHESLLEMIWQASNDFVARRFW